MSDVQPGTELTVNANPNMTCQEPECDEIAHTLRDRRSIRRPPRLVNTMSHPSSNRQLHSSVVEMHGGLEIFSSKGEYCGTRGGGARAPFRDSLRPSDCLRVKYSPPIGYHAYIPYFDWLP